MEVIMLMLVVGGLLLAIFWIALPFLVNATNNRLDTLIKKVEILTAAVQAQQPRTP